MYCGQRFKVLWITGVFYVGSFDNPFDLVRANVYGMWWQKHCRGLYQTPVAA
jgi:hypothetical protein